MNERMSRINPLACAEFRGAFLDTGKGPVGPAGAAETAKSAETAARAAAAAAVVGAAGIN